jgi:hypothetical protein
MQPNGQRPASFGLAGWIAKLTLAVATGVALGVMVSQIPLPVGKFSGVFATLLLLGVASGGQVEQRIKAGTKHRADKEGMLFTLALASEVVTLEPSKTWLQLDHYKWVVRGIIEPPQSLNIFQDGSIEINTEKVSIGDPEGPAKLEHQINKHHVATAIHKPVATATPHPTGTQTSSGKPQFLVKLDHWGHMVIEWGHGLDREETGLRGLTTLIANGLIRKPKTFHVDPLQRGIEIDGIKYDCSEEGAKRLEVALNTRYAITRRTDKALAVEIKENHAASTGFDMHFTIHRAGVPLEIRGHLSQENLDILQDPAKCEILRPDIHLLLTPPNLLFRRRRPDMGEEKIPDVPDVNILHCSAAQLQEALNHPMIRRSTGSAAAAAARRVSSESERIVELRIVKNPAEKAFLWLECVSAMGEVKGPKAFTHHNVTDLQQNGLFLPHLEVHLSLDHRRLSIQNRQTKQEEVITLDTKSSDEDLRKAGRLLTKALKPTEPQATVAREPVEAVHAPAAETPAPAEEIEEEMPVATPPVQTAATGQPPKATPSQPPAAPPPAAEAKPKLDPAITALFNETDAVRINVESFRRLVEWLEFTPQEIHLSLPFVFENRRFEILSFENQKINDLTQLRGIEFYGFYLSHISEKKIVLVYACNGMHIEWGPDKCVLQPTAASEATEYKGSALLGLAQDQQDGFVFIVQPAFKQWIEPREKPYVEESVHFLTVADIAKAPAEYKFIWPERVA